MIKVHLSKLLGEQRMMQTELAEKTDIRPATIHEMYHELIERVNLDYLSRICKVLDCRVEDILEYIPDTRDYPNNHTPPQNGRRRKKLPQGSEI